jgi:hypothetical protein
MYACFTFDVLSKVSYHSMQDLEGRRLAFFEQIKQDFAYSLIELSSNGMESVNVFRQLQ